MYKYELVSVSSWSFSSPARNASGALVVMKVDGERREAHHEGHDGPITAAIEAVCAIIGWHPILHIWHPAALVGNDASPADVGVVIKDDKERSAGDHFAHPDTVYATIAAYVSALNRYDEAMKRRAAELARVTNAATEPAHEPIYKIEGYELD